LPATGENEQSLPPPLTYSCTCLFPSPYTQTAQKFYDSLADHQYSHPDVQKFKPTALRMAKA
jgi:hypothetical protein